MFYSFRKIFYRVLTKNFRSFSCYSFLMGWAEIFKLCDLLGEGFHRDLMSISWVRCNNLAGLIISRFKNVFIAEVIDTQIQHQSNIYSLLYFLCYSQMLYIFFCLVTAYVHYYLNIFCYFYPNSLNMQLLSSWILLYFMEISTQSHSLDST